MWCFGTPQTARTVGVGDSLVIAAGALTVTLAQALGTWSAKLIREKDLKSPTISIAYLGCPNKILESLVYFGFVA